ncbi:MAG TPA: helix-turn-helix transcriptional regulator [Cyclobacteriaceae bacterium]|nr:helix-turn-helix transcriptional regulator [Cyclobacteriaceae bacterium]
MTQPIFTEKEQKILDLIGAGYSSQEIANLLNKSFHTVTTQRKRMLKKMQVSNTAELIQKALSFRQATVQSIVH